MYDYHNKLRATHAASSPWWAWPLDLKPVWFYQDSFAGDTSASIYDAGNLVAWWLSIPAMAFVAWQAFARRSLALGLVFVAFAFQWMPWARIDRATFQYHYYTALPFLLLALAYFLAELWHGPSTPDVAAGPDRGRGRDPRAGARCGCSRGHCARSSGSTAVNPGSEACVATAPGQIVLTWRSAGLAAVLLGVGAILIVQILRLGCAGTITRRGRPPDPLDRPDGRDRGGRAARGRRLPARHRDRQPGRLPDRADRARRAPRADAGRLGRRDRARCAPVRGRGDPRLRDLVRGVVPEHLGLPLPSTIVNAYQGLLPTYLYAFQFPVNTDPVPGALDLMAPLWSGGWIPAGPTLFLCLLATCLIVGYSAWTWRISRAEQAAARRDRDAIASTGQAG